MDGGVGWEEDCAWREEADAEASRGGSGRKLQAEGGRWETRAKISEIRRC